MGFALSTPWGTIAENNIYSIESDRTISLAVAALEADTFTATVDTDTQATVSQNAPVVCTKGNLHRWYGFLSQIETEEATQKLRVVSPVGLLASRTHKGGIYNGQTAGSVIRDICGDIPVSINSAVDGVSLYGWLPYVSPKGAGGAKTGSAKDNLMQVLFATGANLRVAEDGTLLIESISTAVSSIIGNERVWMDTLKFTESSLINAVTITQHTYTQSAERREIFSGQALEGEFVFFDEPMYSLMTTGFSLRESGANYAVLGSGSGTLTGKPYIHVTRDITQTVDTTGTENIIKIEDGTLVSIYNANEICTRVAEYYRHRKKIKFSFDHLQERPGDIVSLEDPETGNPIQACIERLIVEESGISKATAEAIVDFSPWQVAPAEDVTVVLHGGGTWTVPDGVTSINVVLIGHGESGANGQNGNSGETVYYSGRVHPGEDVDLNPGAGGTGGAGGAGGNGGKIYVFSVRTVPGTQYTYGESETEYFFGTQSSSSGEIVPEGYLDPRSGIRYGLRGTDGENGGKGGNGGNTDIGQNTAENGENVGTHIGGTATNFWHYYKEKSSGAYMEIVYGGSGGGGASADSNGANSTTSSFNYNNGGNGANANNGADAQNYGCGGNGGNGGGGGGGCGGVYCNVAVNYGEYAEVYYKPTAGTGGTGGAGGQGAPGCAIVSYRQPISD